tara:strand:- start:255 stop:593 length:339 start_codon:yes stop_codon:yes gene_type:complete
MKADKKNATNIRELIRLGNYLNEEMFRRQVPYFLLLFVLAILYIFNSHHAGRTLRTIGQTDKELKRLRWELMTLESNLMNIGKPSELSVLVDTLGLKELKSPPQIIFVQEDE